MTVTPVVTIPVCMGATAAERRSSRRRTRHKIEGGPAKSSTDLAEQENATAAYVGRLLPLTSLAPDIVEAILGRAAAEGAEACRCAREWAACLGRPEGDLGLQQLTRSCSERFGLGAAQLVL
jgi:hypothetical protein